MHQPKSVGQWYPLIALLLAAIACNAPAFQSDEEYDVRPTRTPLPTFDGPTDMPPITAEAFDVNRLTEGWQPVHPGMEARISYLNVGNIAVEVQLMRIDPAQLDVVVHYDRNIAQPISDWHAMLPEAVMVVNSGFFERTRAPVGLVGLDGSTIGTSLIAHGGMLTVDGDSAFVRSLAQVPYEDSESFDYAIQGRPMLVYPGGFPVSELEGLPEDATRRTAVGQDVEGRLIFVVIDFGAVTIFDFRDWLAESSDQFGIHAAFNLDGGGSTGLSVQTDDYSILIDSQSRLYSAIAIYPR